MRLRHIQLAALPLALLLISSTADAHPSLLADLAPGTERVSGFTDIYKTRLLGGILYFSGKDAAHGLELWRSDGTAAGTWRLTDVCPGPCSGNPSGMALYRGEIYFAADDGVAGVELWATGTAPGTARRVRDLCPGPCGSFPHDLEAGGSRLLFVGATGGQREALWSTNGSRRGTAAVADLCRRPDTDGSFYFPCASGLNRLGDVVLLSVDGRLWRTDGTAAGTYTLHDQIPGLHSVGSMAALGNVRLFWSGITLWRTDGTADGTQPIKTATDLGFNPVLFLLARSIVWKEQLISVTTSGEVIRSDGTPEGTLVLASPPGFPNPIGFAALGDSLLIEYQSPDTLWSTEGTPETTRQVVELPAYSYGIGSLGDRALLCLQPPGGDEPPAQIWVSDGTATGTVRLPVDTGRCWGLGDAPNLAGRALFTGTYGELWASDGTAAGTSVLHDFSLRPASGGPLNQIGLGGKALFSAKTGTQAPLFLSDGTAAGTTQLSEDATWARNFAKAGDKVFFSAFEAAPGAFPSILPLGLWATDGTAAGTSAVAPEIRDYRSPMPVGSSLFFTAAREYSFYNQPDLELFRSAKNHTGLVKNINNYGADTGFHHTCYNAPSDPGPGIELNGRLLFVADEGRHGRELWVSDGTAPGTRLLKDIDPRRIAGNPSDCDERTDSGRGSEPRDFVRHREGVFFTAEEARTGRELWWTDGTAAGTRRVKDVLPGARGSAPHDLVIFRDRVWFIAGLPGGGEGLWQSDGTAAGTRLIDHLRMQDAPSWARELTVAGGQLFFQVYNEVTGPELWASRGTTATTRLVTDLRPGPAGSYPQALTAAGGRLVFAADDGTHGLEPWQSDGTRDGTVPMGDLSPGLGASSPGPFTPLAGDSVLTGADDGVHGREPWVLPVTPEG